MYNQTEKVNIRPKSYLPVFRVSEGDVGRTLTAHLVSDEGDISIPAGATVTMAGTKPSGLGYTVTGTVDGTDVSFETDAVMTDEPGRIVSEIRIVQDGTVIGTTNVVVMVEPDPHPDDTTDGRREPLVNEITALLEQITEQADRVEEYSGKVLNMTVTAHESDEATVTKTEGEVVNLDFGLPRGPQGPQGIPGEDGQDGVTPDFTIGTVETLAPGEQATATITGTEEDPVLNLGIPQGAKGDKGDPGEVTQADFDKLLITDTASGEIASFPDGAAFPMRSLKITLEPIQSGSGTPSPDNVRPISGWDSVETVVSGVNVWDEEWEVGGLAWATGQPVAVTDRYRSKNFCGCEPNTAYYGDKSFSIFFYDEEKNFISYDGFYHSVVTTPQNCHYFKITDSSSATYNNDISINYPSTDHDYHAYDGQTITTDLPQTVYGGTLDVVSGVLTVDRAIVDLGTLNWIRLTNSHKTYFQTIAEVSDMKKSTGNTYIQPILCSNYETESWTHALDTDAYDWVICEGWANKSYIVIADSTKASLDVASFKTAMNGVQLCYELATPTSYSLTPQEVQTLLGRNNVWSDGTVSVEYVADPKRYIEKMIGA